jgi:hypothetical protein
LEMQPVDLVTGKINPLRATPASATLKGTIV